MVRRVNALVTTFLDLLATLLFAAGAMLSVWQVADMWVGLLAAGVVVTLLSALAQHRARPLEPAPAGDEDEPLPGPASAGNLHVMGR
jgi:hypothetical protein